MAANFASVQFVHFLQNPEADLFETGGRAIVREDPAPVMEGMRVFKTRRPDGRTAHMRDDGARIDLGGGTCAMLAMKCGPSLFFDDRQAVGVVGDTPPVAMHRSFHDAFALHHERVLRPDQPVFDASRRVGVQGIETAYLGACSLDAVLRRAKSGRRELHWIECNGRWSGVSIPLAAGTEILGGTDPKGILIVQDFLPASTAMDTETISALLGDLLFRRGVTQDDIVILSPPHSVDGVSLNAMALSDSQVKVEELMSLAHKRLGGRP